MRKITKGATLSLMATLIAATSGLIVRGGLAEPAGASSLPLATMAMAMVAVGAMVAAVGSGLVVLKAVEP
jgi:hypothetical protein